MSDVLEIPDVCQEYRGVMYSGKLRLQKNNITYKSTKTGKVEQYQTSELEEAHWMRRTVGYCLRICIKPGYIYMFDGFKESDYDKLSEYIMKNYKLNLVKKERCLKGWNCFQTEFTENTLILQNDNKTVVEIPLANVAHSRMTKNDVTLEFHQNDDSSISLVEATFYVSSTKDAEEFHERVMSKADVVQATGDAITIFSEVQCLTPRGRYDIKIYPSFFQLHGKTFDYKIPYSTILRLFLLPHRDNRQLFFTISLDPPIKQGQTRYHFLVFSFNKEIEMSVDLTLSKEDIEKKYDGKLQKNMSGPEHEVISQIMKVLVNKKITIPGSFLGHTKSHSISCSYRAATGYLYPLERGFMFVPKPPLHIRFDEVSAVNFGRSAGSNRSFDFDVETTNGPVYNFVGIEKEEYGHLYDFVKQKNLRIKNIDKDDKNATSYVDDMEESDDEDRVHKAYMEKMKSERKDRDDDDEDESDESFKPDASHSEPDDEYDSNLESTSESGEDHEDGSVKKKKTKKRERKEEDEDEEGEEGDKKKHSKEKKHKSSAKKDDDDDDDNMDVDEDDEEQEEKKSKKKEKKVKKTKTKEKKKEKDPNEPKRSQSAYFLWMAEIRPQLKEEFPGISVTELSKKAGERWKEVKDKSKWEKMAMKDKARYESEMSKYKKGERSSPSRKEKKSSKKEESSSHGSGAGFKSKEFISDAESDEGSAGGIEDDSD